MTIFLVACGLVVAAVLACCGPATAYSKQFDIAAGAVLVLSLAFAGLQLPIMA